MSRRYVVHQRADCLVPGYGPSFAESKPYRFKLWAKFHAVMGRGPSITGLFVLTSWIEEVDV